VPHHFRVCSWRTVGLYWQNIVWIRTSCLIISICGSNTNCQRHWLPRGRIFSQQITHLRRTTLSRRDYRSVYKWIKNYTCKRWKSSPDRRKKSYLRRKQLTRRKTAIWLLTCTDAKCIYDKKTQYQSYSKFSWHICTNTLHLQALAQ
jgi:hypothetical protein